MTWRPAEIFGLGDRKGRLAEGLRRRPDDLRRARKPTRSGAADSVTNAKWSPFDGAEFDGRVEATFVRGRPVYEDGRVSAAPGSGSWLRRGA